jgi:hypothetical protein
MRLCVLEPNIRAIRRTMRAPLPERPIRISASRLGLRELPRSSRGRSLDGVVSVRSGFGIV